MTLRTTICRSALIAALLAGSPAVAKEPDCYGAERWAANMAIATLKDMGITESDKIDFSKTRAVKLASEKTGKEKSTKDDLYRQVQNITFVEKSGKTIEVITISDATRTECSMGGVEVYLVSQHLNSDHAVGEAVPQNTAK